ncbi:hypothetical protein C8R45DRAFT_926516 [Mycena sanguinolenta]|nr:hypothetical protein C8R45DRAFT_926516 [Mycena sanguinolenta]
MPNSIIVRDGGVLKFCRVIQRLRTKNPSKLKPVLVQRTSGDPYCSIAVLAGTESGRAVVHAILIVALETHLPKNAVTLCEVEKGMRAVIVAYSLVSRRRSGGGHNMDGIPGHTSPNYHQIYIKYSLVSKYTGYAKVYRRVSGVPNIQYITVYFSIHRKLPGISVVRKNKFPDICPSNVSHRPSQNLKLRTSTDADIGAALGTYLVGPSAGAWDKVGASIQPEQRRQHNNNAGYEITVSNQLVWVKFEITNGETQSEASLRASSLHWTSTARAGRKGKIVDP